MSANIAESSQIELLGLVTSGVARSMERLSALSGAPWHVHIVSIDAGPGERFRSILARDSRANLGVCFSSPGERYLVMFSDESGEALLRSNPLGLPARRASAPGMDRSVLAEVANILINGLSGELADRQGMARVISAPKTVRGRKADLYDRAFGGLPRLGGDSVVNVLIHVSSPDLAADCTLMLRLDALSATFLLNADPDAPPRFDPD